MARRELAAGIRRARLHEHRTPLRRARQVQWTLHLIVRPCVIDGPYPPRVRIASSGAVVENRIVGPAVPEAFDDGHVFFGAFVAVRVAHLADTAEIAARLRRPCGDDVPADAAAADVIQRTELPREVVGLGVRGRGGRDQSDAARLHGESGERRDRLEPVERRPLNVVPQSQNVREEDRVEQAGLGLLRHLHRVADIGERQLRRLRVPP